MKLKFGPEPWRVVTVPVHYVEHFKDITFPVSVAALEILERSGVPPEQAVLNLSPRGEQDCGERIASFFGRAARGMWNTRKILDWMGAANSKNNITVRMPEWRWALVEKASAAVGVSPADWCVYAIGYRAVYETKRSGGIIALTDLQEAQKKESREKPLPQMDWPRPNPTPPPCDAEENTLIFHKCRHCPHGFKPWDSPRTAS